MKDIPASLLAHLQGQCTTLATIWLISRRDGQIFAFTDLDADIEFQGRLYKAATGFTPSSVANNSDLSVDNLDVVGVLNSATITDADLLAGLWDYAEVLIRKVNYMDLSMGAFTTSKGHIGEIKTGRSQFTAELRGLTQNLQQSVAKVYATSCSAKLFDGKCRVDRASRTYSGIVTGVASNRAFSTDLTALAAGICNNGVVTWLSGANAGRKMEVKFFGGSGAALNGEHNGTLGAANIPKLTISLPAGATLTSIYRVTDDTGLEYTPSSGSPGVGQYFQVGSTLEFNEEDRAKTVSVKYGYSAFIGGVSGDVQLQEAMFGAVSPGDTFEITEGCDGTIETCRDKFSNVVNFRGFPWIRSPDELLRGA